MKRKASSTVTIMPVVNLRKCHTRMLNREVLPYDDYKYYSTFIQELLGEFGPDVGKESDTPEYRLYTFSTSLITPTEIDSADIRDVFEDFLSWELNIPQTKEDGSPTEILLKL